jgi:hypothetical protein
MNLQLTKLSSVLTLCATLWLAALANAAWATLSCDLTTFGNLISTGVIRPRDHSLRDRPPSARPSKSCREYTFRT